MSRTEVITEPIDLIEALRYCENYPKLENFIWSEITYEKNELILDTSGLKRSHDEYLGDDIYTTLLSYPISGFRDVVLYLHSNAIEYRIISNVVQYDA